MMKKLKERKGFTMAELLIVVAIVAVLVAVSIPVFTSKLEAAREATDLANIRAIYAQLSADVLTENATNTATAGAKEYKVEKDSSGVFKGTATYKMTQKTAGLTGADSVSIGGVEIISEKFKTGDCTITVTDNGNPPTISIS